MAKTLSKLEIFILGRLASKPMSGYGLRKWLLKEGPFLGYTPQLSQIYRQLNRAHAHGWLDVSVDTNTAGPDAKVYSLTASGLEVFRDWAYSPHQPSVRPLDSDLQMRMLLCGVFGPRLILEVLRAELEYRRKQEMESQAYQDSIDPAEAALPIDVEWQNHLVSIVGERSFLLGRTNLTWLEMTYARLQARVDELDELDGSQLASADETPSIK